MFRCHRNLNAGKDRSRTWSYYRKSGERVQPASSLILYDVTIKDPSGKAWEECYRNGGSRAVFTWWKAERYEINVPINLPSNAVRIRYDPRVDRYFRTEDGERVSSMVQAWLTPYGEAYALLP